ncbi:MAG: hypothetical protein M1482_00105 [Chloroflexi bacterium]|nr:hypothetical protein [Chloroflexota bacterium]
MAGRDFQKGDVVDRIDELIGHVSSEGRVTDWSSTYVGRVRLDGAVFDYNGDRIGYVAAGGTLFDWREIPIGRLRDDGHALDYGGRDVGYIVDMPPLPAGAAAILLLILRVIRTGLIERRE